MFSKRTVVPLLADCSPPFTKRGTTIRVLEYPFSCRKGGVQSPFYQKRGSTIRVLQPPLLAHNRSKAREPKHDVSDGVHRVVEHFDGLLLAGFSVDALGPAVELELLFDAGGVVLAGELLVALALPQNYKGVSKDTGKKIKHDMAGRIVGGFFAKGVPVDYAKAKAEADRMPPEAFLKGGK